MTPNVTAVRARAAHTPHPSLDPLAAAVALALLSIGSAGAARAQALPGHHTLKGGDAIVTQTNPTTMTINQSTQRAALEWQTFSIGSGNTVVFNQPNASSVILNRVVGGSRSEIFGSLQANGQVFLLNPAGVYMSRTASIDVGGLVASTLDMAVPDFMKGRYAFTGGSASTGAITNEANITVPKGGYVAFLGKQVHNTGTITAGNGSVAFGAGEAMLLDFDGDGLLQLKVNAAAADASVTHGGVIHADGGRVVMSAAAKNALLKTVLNVDGMITARGMKERDGYVYLDGGRSGVTAVAGTLDASNVSGGKGGEIRVLGENVGLFGNALLDASGATGGGTVLVGGDFQGKNPDIPNAFRTYVGPSARIRADAIRVGDGGKVIVWADDTTRYFGSISARGGAQGGDGGFVEVSGKQNLAFTGNADVSAPKGKDGTILLDPADILIVPGAVGADNGQVSGDNQVLFGDAGTTFTIAEATLEGLSGNVLLQATNSITNTAPLDFTNQTGGTRVAFQAGGNVTNSNTITTAGGAIVLEADSPHSTVGAADGTGTLAIGALGAVTSNGGNITLIGADFTIGAAVNAGAGVLSVAPSNNAAMTLGTGTLSALEIDQLSTTNVLRIGTATTAGTDNTGAGALTRTAASITVDAPLAPANATTLHLVAAGAITQTGTGTITEDNLAVTAAGAVNLSLANTVTTFAAANAGNNVSFDEADGFTIASVAGVSGITAGTAFLRAGGTIAQTAPITATTLGVRATAGDINLNSASNAVADLGLSTAAGNVTYRDSDGVNVAIVNDPVGGLGSVPGLSAAGANAVFVQAAGNVTQSANAAVTAQRVGVRATGAGSSVTLLEPTNIAFMAAITAPGTVSFSSSQSFEVTPVADPIGGLTTVSFVDGGGAVALTSRGDSRVITIANGSGVASPTSVSITADRLDLVGTGFIAGNTGATAAAGSVVVRPFTANRKITLGTNDVDATSATTGTLGITPAELALINATTLTVGRSDGGNAAGDLSVTAAFAPPASTTTVVLETGGSITQSATITATNLALVAGTGVTLTGAGNQVQNLSGRVTGTGNFAFSQTNALNVVNLAAVGHAASTTGIQTANGSIALSSNQVSLSANLLSNGAGAGGAVSITGPVLLNANATIDTDAAGGATGAGNVTFSNTINSGIGGPFNLTVDASADGGGAGGAVNFANAIGGTDPINALTILGSSLTFTGTQNAQSLAVTLSGAGNGFTYLDADGVQISGNAITTNNGNVTLNTPVTVSGTTAISIGTGTLIFPQTLAVGANTVTLTANGIDFTSGAGSVTGPGGTLVLQPAAAGTSIGIGDSAGGTLNLSSADVAALADGFTQITIGRSDGTGTTTINNGVPPVTFSDPLLIRQPGVGGSIIVNGALQGTDNASITLTAPTTVLNANVTTAGTDLQINGAVRVAQNAAITLSTGPGAGNIAVTGATEGTTGGGTESLTLNAGTGTVSLQGVFGSGAAADSTGLTSLTITNAAATGFNGAIAITGTLEQSNAVTGTTTFGNTVSVGAATLRGTDFNVGNSFATTTGALTVDNSGMFNATGAINAAGGFSTTGNATLAANVTTTNTDITIGANLTIAENANVTLSTGSGAGNILVNGATDGTALGAAESLTVLAGTGSVTFTGNVGSAGTTSLEALTITSAANVLFSSPIDLAGALTQSAGSGTTTFNGAVSAGSASLAGNAFAVNNSFTAPGGFSATGNVTLGGNITTTDTDLSISGNLVIAQGASPTLSTGAGGGGNILVSGTTQGTAAGAAESLTVLAGTGNVTFSGGVGNGLNATELEALTITSATNVFFLGSLNLANALVQSAGSGATTFAATVNVGSASLTGAAFNVNNTFNSTGAVAVNNTGTLTTTGGITTGGDFTVSGNAVLANNVTTSNDLIQIGGTLTVDQGVLVTLSTQSTAGAGNITIGGAINGTAGGAAESLRLNAGTGTVNLASVSGAGGVADANGLTTLTLTNSGTTNFNGPIAITGALTQTNPATGVTTFNGPVNVGSATLRGTSFVLNDNVTTADGNLRFEGNFQIAEGNSVTLSTGAAGGGDITITGTTNGTAGGAAESLTALAGTGNVTFTGNVGNSANATELEALTITSAATTLFGGRIDLTNALTQSAGSVATTFNGAVDVGSASLTGAAFNVNNSFTSAQALAVTNTGTFTKSATGEITTGGDFTVSGNANLASNVTTSNDLIQIGGALTIADGRSMTLSTQSAAGAGDITVSGTTRGTAGGAGETLTLNAGTGTVNLGPVFGSGSAGDATGLTALTVSNAGAVNFNGGVALTGAVAVNNTGLFTKNAAGAITALGGFSTTGNARLASDVTTRNTPLTIGGTLTVAEGRSVTLSTQAAAGAGNITVGGATNGTTGGAAESLTLDAGTGTLNLAGVFGAAGAADTAGLTTLTVTNAGTTHFNGPIAIAGALAQTNAATGVTTFSGPVSAGSANLRGTTFVLNDNVTTADGTLRFEGNLVVAEGKQVTLSTGAAGAGDITVTGTTNGTAGGASERLTALAGTGNVTFTGNVGNNANATELEALTIASAANALFSGSVDLAGALAQTAGSGATTFTGAVNVGSASLTGAAFNVNESFTSSGATAIANSGVFTKGATGRISAAGGFSVSGDAVLRNAITTSNAPFSIGGTTTLLGATSVTTAGGAVTFTGAVGADAFGSGRTLVVNSSGGTMTFGNGIGTPQALGGVTLGAGNADITGNVLITGGGSVDFSALTTLKVRDGARIDTHRSGAAGPAGAVRFGSDTKVEPATINAALTIDASTDTGAAAGNVDIGAIGEVTPLGVLNVLGANVTVNNRVQSRQIGINADSVLTAGPGILVASQTFGGNTATGNAAVRLQGLTTAGLFGRVDNPIHIAAPGLFVVIPNESNTLPVVFLRGDPALKPVYEFAEDPSRRVVLYNGVAPDSPAARAALGAALAPIREIISEVLLAGFAKENIRQQLIYGQVLEAGLSRPGIDEFTGEGVSPQPSCAGSQSAAQAGAIACQ